MTIYNSRIYQYIFCAVAMYICCAPLLILEDPRDEWQLSHYNIVEYFCWGLMLDPLLVLVFIGRSPLSIRP